MVRRLVVAAALLVLASCTTTDADVNRRVLIRLAKEPTPSEQFTVTTHAHVVRLKGVVHSATEREHLERAAREVDGVAGVENELVVDAPVELTHGTFLAADPVDALLRDSLRARLDAQELDDIAVEVTDREITLKGEVPQAIHDAAMRIAEEATRTDNAARITDAMTIAR